MLLLQCLLFCIFAEIPYGAELSEQQVDKAIEYLKKEAERYKELICLETRPMLLGCNTCLCKKGIPMCTVMNCSRVPKKNWGSVVLLNLAKTSAIEFDDLQKQTWNTNQANQPKSRIDFSRMGFAARLAASGVYSMYRGVLKRKRSSTSQMKALTIREKVIKVMQAILLEKEKKIKKMYEATALGQADAKAAKEKIKAMEKEKERLLARLEQEKATALATQKDDMGKQFEKDKREFKKQLIKEASEAQYDIVVGELICREDMPLEKRKYCELKSKVLKKQVFGCLDNKQYYSSLNVTLTKLKKVLKSFDNIFVAVSDDAAIDKVPLMCEALYVD